MEEESVDLRIPNPEGLERGRRYTELQFRLNHTLPTTEEYTQILHELFKGKMLDKERFAE